MAIKTAEQQGLMALHRLREGFREDRTAGINRLRGVLTEFGRVFAKSPKVLRAALADVLEDAGNELSGIARLAVNVAFGHWRELDDRLRWCDQRIGQHVRTNAAARRAAHITGIGAIGASAFTASVGDFKQSDSGAQFSAWMGIVPRQNSSSGKTRLGRITKRARPHAAVLRPAPRRGLAAPYFERAGCPRAIRSGVGLNVATGKAG